MRAEFARAMIALYDQVPNLVFLTGDLGFMALEGVRARYGERFINAGVAEQNMICVAAGLAHEGLIPWVYDIAPFAVLRPYEQIRNDICLHNLPVKIIGNGGGYGYGIMGATHHTLEDIGIMRVLPNMKVYVPLVAADVAEVVRTMALDPSPNYLRLNIPATLENTVPPFNRWRRLQQGTAGVVIGTGPVVANVLTLPQGELVRDLDIWCVGVFPIRDLPEELVRSVRRTKKVLTIEEHYGQCGLNEAVARLLLDRVESPILYTALSAAGYPSGTYGSQQWHQQESGLAGEPLAERLRRTFYV